MIGDNENDAAAARAAGLPVLLARYGYPRLPLAEIAADCEIDAFAELPRALAELEE
jgi:phosphoglycolate phosphatase